MQYTLLWNPINSLQKILFISLYLLKIGADSKTLKIADVGIAINEADVTGTFAGTPLYMAPEVYNESGIYNSMADIYSFGLILWELWYGQRVFAGESPKKVMVKIEEGEKPHHIAGCHPVILSLDSLIQKCWQTDPKDRVDAEECVKQLNSTLESLNN